MKAEVFVRESFADEAHKLDIDKVQTDADKIDDDKKRSIQNRDRFFRQYATRKHPKKNQGRIGKKDRGYIENNSVQECMNNVAGGVVGKKI